MCSCKKNKQYLKGDWGYWKLTCGNCVARGFGRETFVRYTLKHRIRLFLGIHGQQHNGKYYFNFCSGLLNRIFGYKKI